MVALCTSCKVAVPKDCMSNNLRPWHKGCKNRQAIIDEFRALPIAASITELTTCTDGSPALSFLLPPEPGYCCPECTSFRTISWVEFRKHRKKSHSKTTSRSEKEDMSCHLQRWTIGRGHYCSQYWLVDIQAPPNSCCLPSSEIAVVEDEVDVAERTLAVMEADEEARLREEDQRDATFDFELDMDENSDWLRGCGWPKWFRQKPMAILLAAATVPNRGCARDLFLGSWNGVDCISPAASEKALQLLSTATQQVLSRCQESLISTPRVLRCWVRSWGHSFSPYPFSLPTPPTLRKYSRIWTSAVCYFMRLRMLSRRLHESTTHLCGFELSNPQKSALDSVWATLIGITAFTLVFHSGTCRVPTLQPPAPKVPVWNVSRSASCRGKVAAPGTRRECRPILAPWNPSRTLNRGLPPASELPSWNVSRL